MKKTILCIMVLMQTSLASYASEKENKVKGPGDQPHCFELGNKLINVGVGIGGYRYYSSIGGGYTYRNPPSITLSYEQAWPKKLGPGFLGVGAYFGFKHSQARYEGYDYFNNNNYYYEHSWNNFVLAARGVYHWDVLNSKKAEVYGGVLAGLRIATYSYNSNGSGPFVSSTKRSSDSGVMPLGSLFVGARWYFVPKVALYAEAGYGVSYLTAGVTFKF